MRLRCPFYLGRRTLGLPTVSDPLPIPADRVAGFAYPGVFRHRNYRLFFFGQLISLVGFWMQAIAQSWLVYRLTDSSLLLGLVSFAGQAPMLFFTPFAGVVADRLPRKRILFVTQIAMMSCATVFSLLAITGIVLCNRGPRSV